MTAEQAAQVIQLLSDVKIISVAIAVTLCMILGAITWRLIVLAKNQRHLW